MKRQFLKPAAIASVLLGLLVLTGCVESPTVEPPTETTSTATAAPKPTATPKSTAPPSPTPTPTIDPADPIHWIVSFDGIGPLRLGKPYSTSNPELIEFAPGDSNYYDPRVRSLDETQGAFANRLSFTIRLNQGMDMIKDHIAMVLTDQVAGRVEGPRTDRGIGTGSSEADTRAAYPSGVSMFIVLSDPSYPNDPTFPYLSVPDGSGHFILFYFGDNGGPVTRIAVQTFASDVYEYA